METVAVEPVVEKTNGKKAATKVPYDLEIKRPVRKALLVQIDGTSALLCNRMSDLALKSLKKLSLTADEKKLMFDREYGWSESIYRDETGQYAFPAMNVFRSILAVGEVDGKKENKLRRWISLASEEPMLPLHLPPFKDRPNEERGPEGREDIIRNWQARGVKAVAYRSMFRCPWSLVVPILYNASRLKLADVTAIIDQAGFEIGIGCWRPDCKGIFGRYVVSMAKEVDL